jgi:hypothetical protein
MSKLKVNDIKQAAGIGFLHISLMKVSKAFQMESGLIKSTGT